MVRTLDFHSKNVGSNPASLTIKRYSIKINKPFIGNNVKYFKINYTFISLYPPHKIGKVSLTNFIQDKSIKNRKILIKQSYLLATWFNYLVKSLTKKNKDINTHNTNYKPSLFVQPLRTYKTTMIKAPMAHKTFSQEQFRVEFYKINLSCPFNGGYYQTNDFPQINQTLLIYLSLKKLLFFFGTNLFFLKRIGLNLLSSDSKFFLIQ